MSRVPSLPEVHFAPWTGENFGDKVVLGHHRILLVGESHYERCDLCRTEGNERTADLTSFCIAERISLIDCVKHKQHYPKIENAFLGLAATSQERQEFWESVAYYNFLQELLAGPRVPIAPRLWKDAQRAFVVVIETLRPELIVVVGRRVWHHLPPPYSIEVTLSVAGKTLERRRYQLAGGQVIASGVAHPAAGLGAPWQPALRRATEGLE